MTKLNKWTCPDSYFGKEWPEYYVFIGKTRDSDLIESGESIFAARRDSFPDSAFDMLREIVN